MAAIDEVLSILANSKNVLELTTMTVLSNTDWAVVWNINTNKAEKVSVAELTKIGDFYHIESSLVLKKAGNTDLTTIESGDEVWFKKITNVADPITLMGHTYDVLDVGGLDKQIETSYSMEQSISI